MTASGDRRSLTVTLMPSSRSSSRRPTSIGRFTTRVTVARSVSSSAAAAGRSAEAPSASASVTSSKRAHLMVMSAPSRGRQRGRDDVLVARAAAQVAGDRLPHLGLGRIRGLPQEARERHQEARRAEAALKAVMLAERLLKRIEPVAVGETLHGLDLAPVYLRREQQTRAHGGAVEHDRARAADAVLAPEMGAGEVEVVPEEVGQGLPYLDRPLVHASVHGDPDGPLVHGRSFAPGCPSTRSRARASARRVSTPARCWRYSAEAWRSLSGVSPLATRPPMSASASTVGLTPTSAREASRTTTGVGPTPVSAIAQAVQTPPVSTVIDAATPTRAKSPCRRLTSMKAVPVRGGVTGTRASTSSSSGAAAVVR